MGKFVSSEDLQLVISESLANNDVFIRGYKPQIITDNKVYTLWLFFGTLLMVHCAQTGKIDSFSSVSDDFHYSILTNYDALVSSTLQDMAIFMC